MTEKRTRVKKASKAQLLAVANMLETTEHDHDEPLYEEAVRIVRDEIRATAERRV